MRNMLSKLRKSDELLDAAGQEPALTPKRRRVVPFHKRPQTVFITAVLGLGIVAGGLHWSWKNGFVQDAYAQVKWSVIKVTADLGFTVQEVLVTGRGETARDDLLATLGIQRGAPILAYDFAQARERVEELPWVFQARVERLLPDTLVIHLTERRPMALWQHRGSFSLIDDNGVVITHNALDRFSNLIQVVGEDAPDHVGGLLELLETQPELLAQVKAAVRVGGRRWDLSLQGGVDVRLPEDNAPKALARLAAFEQESGVLARDIRVLDLRMPDRVIVRRNVIPERRPKRKGGQQT
ncbi:cell division protein FtsQ/DivIB [Magnetovibrio sp. PR-2]|uniref:cell division protein FtsQ/DivIB n=1 Tax=Magnetovibrio sp. PR-2 TaxID=3120356 RepID=UPI002FCE661F